ncbi:thioredoxin-disulfide reductase [Peptostreptococcus canis]|uniref:Thioredoxin reductase n=1 Tax=Peptostreptococcus canis TaxID=1159213 RepID=A0ABR6TIF7_9FIRM|nr:thioredoxin-disulfide reductase [Peptostreptococcus canis]MBC2575179.1 thioredoxin-disulfide reductase [Peptostreptococcus canis]MBP1997646.1 thioredoxin reductase (NADPH) [Peptostreptococcus canis]
MSEKEIYDIVIIGGGPGGMTAGVYGGRAELKTLILEKSFHGGQMVSTSDIENYPALPETNGIQLSNDMLEHAKKFGAKIDYKGVDSIEVLEDGTKKLVTGGEEILTKTVILSMGSTSRKLGIPNEEKFTGRGVGYCAICDGGFYRNKVVAVNGGGDTAVEDALYLSRIASKVYLVHRRDELRANKTLQTRLFESDVEVVWNSTIKEIQGDDKLNAIVTVDKTDGSERTIELDGLFIAIGGIPTSDLVKNLVDLDPQGYIITNENCETNIPGIFAVGDIRKKSLRQIITAAADGAIAVHSAEKYILEH